jgi:putative inorganic carbon (hco3(-)) transporter
MDHPFSALCLRAQRGLIAIAVAGSALLVWRSPSDAYALPKATFVVMAAVLIGAIGVARVIVLRRVELPVGPVGLGMAVVSVALLVATVSSSLPLVSAVGPPRYTGLVPYMAYAVIGLSAVRAFRDEPPVGLLRAVLLAAGIQVSYGLAQSFGWQPLPFGTFATPVFGTLGNSNFFSGWLAIVAPVALWATVAERSPKARIAAGLLLAGAALALVRSGSFQGIPAALAGLAFAAVVLLVAARSGRPALAQRLPIGRTLWIGGGAVLVLALLVAPRAWPLVLRAAGSGADARMEYWAASVDLIRDHPILGTGPGTFAQNFAAYYEPSGVIPFELADDPHSVPLAMFDGGGLVLGLAWLLFLGLTGWVLVRGITRQKSDRMLLAALGGAWVAYQVQSFVSIDIPPLALAHFVLAGCIAARCAPRFAFAPAVATVEQPRRAGHPRRRVPLRPGARVGVSMVGVIAALLLVFTLQPMQASAAADRAADLLEQNDSLGAIREARTATTRAPWADRHWWVYGQAYERAQELEKAIEMGRKAHELAPANVGYSLVLGRIAAQQRDFQASLEWNKRAHEADPRHHQAIVGLAKAYLTLGQIEEAKRITELGFEAHAERLNKSNIELAELWAVEGRRLHLTGDTPGAQRAFQRALEADPNSREALSFFGRG